MIGNSSKKNKIKARMVVVNSTFRGYNRNTAPRSGQPRLCKETALGNETKTDKVWPWWHMAIVDPIIWETEGGGSLHVPGQPELPSKIAVSTIGGWRDESLVKNIGCSSRPKFKSQHQRAG